MGSRNNLKNHSNYRWLKTSLLFFLTSFVLHGLVYVGLKKTPSNRFFSQEQPKKSLVEFELIDKKDKQFMSDTEIGKIIKDLKQQSRFLSKLNRRVKKQSVASKSGPTKNHFKQKSNFNLLKKLRPEIKSTLKDKAGIAHKNKPKPKFTRQSARKSFSATQISSTIAEYVPHVDKGEITALNTDQFTHYTFFYRINQQIHPRWGRNLREITERLTPMQYDVLAQKPRVTEVEIITDTKGQFIESFVHKSSGLNSLDRAVIFAFRSAMPFVNPPTELIEDDGYIHLHYSFHVSWKPRRFAGP